jgi:crotonobetainyl-CoA:carnitine CoA-transferase CaiB-like acyl-CoA transferase
MPDSADTSPTAQHAIASILDCMDWSGRSPDTLAISGADPILATRFRIGTCGIGVLGAVALAADALHHAKTGRHQDIAISHRAAALAMRSNRHVRVLDTGEMRDGWNDISGLYQCGDGHWVQLHCNYPWLAEGILEILGCPAERPRIEAALATWDAQAFEDAVAEKNLCAFMVRSRDEWDRHPQSRAIAEQPLMTIEKIGDAPVEPLPEGDRPLSGVRAVELTRVIAGPVSGRTLAEHGAQVMRIGRADRPDDLGLVRDTGLGKLATDLDLRDAADAARLDDLIRGADVVTQGHRPGTLAAKGLSPERLAGLRPGIVFVSLCAWGDKGPWAHRRGFDSLVQCATGIAAEQGGMDSPRHLPAQALDYVTGYLAAFGAMEGLRRRATIGGSWMVRLSLAQSAKWIDDLGRTGDASAMTLADPKNEDIPEFLETHDTVWGRMEHIKPVLEMSETPPRWDLPPVPLGSHPPVWPD